MYKLNSYYVLDDYFDGVAVEDGTLKVDRETGEITFIDENGNVYTTNEKINLDEYYSRNKYIDSDADTRTLVSELYDSGNIDINDFNYLNMLIDYDKFVNENYTQLPENTKSFLQKFIKDKNINTSSMDNTIIDVMSLLVGSNEYKYTLSPGKTPDGEDFVEYFLSKNKKVIVGILPHQQFYYFVRQEYLQDTQRALNLTLQSSQISVLSKCSIQMPTHG